MLLALGGNRVQQQSIFIEKELIQGRTSSTKTTSDNNTTAFASSNQGWSVVLSTVPKYQ